MSIALGHRFTRAAAQAIAVTLLAASLAACSGTGFVDDGVKFSSAAYGVAASERVVRYGPVPRGGGRYQVGQPYRVAGRWFTPEADTNYDETGTASWYGPNFHGRVTANGEIFDSGFLSAAHPTLPLPSYVRVTNLRNGRSAIVRVNDRGPFARDRLIDLSQRAAEVLGFINSGTAQVRVQYVGAAPLEGDDSRYLTASINSPNATVPTGGGTNRSSSVPSGRSPSPISREAGGLVGSFISLFSYADAKAGDQIINEAFAATEAMAAPSSQLETWRLANDLDERKVDMPIGIFDDLSEANEFARQFAMFGAIDYDHSDLPEGMVRLRLTYLKSGVTREDVDGLLAEIVQTP